MAEKISVQIELQGGDQVQQQFEGIGEAGQQAFAGIEKPAQQATRSLNNVGEAATEAGTKAKESFLEVAEQAARTGKEVAGLVGEIAKYGVEIGLAVQKHKGWVDGLLKVGSAANTALRAISAFGPELAILGTGLGTAAVAAAGLAVGLEAAEKAVTKFASADEKLNHSLQQLAETSGQSFKSLQDGKATLEQLGIGGDRFEDVITKMNEAMSSLDIGGKFKEGADAIEKAGALTNEHFKALANNMGAVLPLVKQIEAGVKGLTFDPLTTAQTKIDAVTASMKQAVDAGKNAGQALIQFIINADKLSAIQVGKAFGITDEDVDRIRRLAAAGVSVDEIFKRVQSAGPLISPEAAASFDKMRTSIAKVDSAWARLSQALKSTIFAKVAADMSDMLNTLKEAVISFGAAAVESFNRAGAGMANMAANTLREFTQLAQLLQRGLQLQGISLPGLDELIIKAQAATNALQQTGQTGAQAGQQTAQGLQLVRDPLTGLVAGVQKIGPAMAQAGQQTAQGLELVRDPLTGLVTGVQKIEPAAQAAASGSQSAFQTITTAIQSAGTAVSDFVSTIASITWDTISSAGVAAWNAITDAINSAISKVGDFINKLLQAIGLQSKAGSGGSGGGAPGKARGGLIGGRGSGTSDSNLAWLSRGEHVMPARVVRQPGVLGFLEALRRGGSLPGFADGGQVGGGPNLSGFISSLGRAIGDVKNIWEALINGMQGVYQSLAKALKQHETQLAGVVRQSDQVVRNTVESLQKLQLTLGIILGETITAMQGRARGGLIGGRGTGTSDSNLAWVSRGEHIMPARAVRQPGVLAFLEALRRSGGNLRDVLDGMGRFALGGLVPRPAFANGGPVGGMSNVTINFPGLQPITGLRASASVVDELHRAAALAQVRSGGRKPSRYS